MNLEADIVHADNNASFPKYFLFRFAAFQAFQPLAIIIIEELLEFFDDQFFFHALLVS
ncbi:hypothetical protein [Breoghania sp.]|uniref:hypothetical protein n=1 Tax=Breoghania sp. TaxID=2065378 RepID=UPI00262BF678|nr:hypothetical protein [Breoghania sp.]MDJ0933006.1 hypothetical protein [Breoghania sp.]